MVAARLVLVSSVMLVSARAEAKVACTVHGTDVTLEAVTVKPPGQPAFQIGLRGVPASVEVPRRCGAPLSLQVTGALTFKATHNRPWLSLTRDVVSSDGSIVARKGARVIDACMRGDQVVVSAVTYSDDVLPGEDKPPDELVTGLDVACDALTLDAVEQVDEAELAPGTEHNWELRGHATSVALHLRPKAGSASHRVRTDNCGGCLNVRELRRKSGWLFVEATGEGVSARGWVPRSALKPIPDDTFVGRSYMCTGDHGGGTFGEAGLSNYVERTGTLRGGTPVFVDAGTGQWAVATVDTRVTVRMQAGVAWAELRHVDGLGGPNGSPWYDAVVRLDAVTLDPLPASPPKP